MDVGPSGRLLGADRVLEVDVDAVQVVKAGVVDVVRHPVGSVRGVRHVRLQEIGCRGGWCEVGNKTREATISVGTH